MKKTIAMMLAVLTAVSMAACAKKQPQPAEPVKQSITPTEPDRGPSVTATEEGADTAEAVAQKAMEARNQYSYSRVLALVHEEYIKNVAARLRMNVDEMFLMYDENALGLYQELEQEKGHFAIGGQLGEQKALAEADLAALQERYEDLYELTVTDAVEISFTTVMEFDSGEEESKETMILVLIDGKWYLDLAGIRLL